MPTKYDNWTAQDSIDKSLLDNDIHYLHGDISNENISEAIKWIISANLDKKPKRKLKLYINSYGGDLYEAFALIDVMKESHHAISTIGVGAVMSELARQALRRPAGKEKPRSERSGLPLLPINTSGGVVDLNLMNQLRDDER